MQPIDSRYFTAEALRDYQRRNRPPRVQLPTLLRAVEALLTEPGCAITQRLSPSPVQHTDIHEPGEDEVTELVRY